MRRRPLISPSDPVTYCATRCQLRGVGVSGVDLIGRHTEADHCLSEHCTFSLCVISGFHISNTRIHDCQFDEASTFVSCHFDSVELSSCTGSLKIEKENTRANTPLKFQSKMNLRSKCLYRSGRAAIDISSCDELDLSIDGIPGKLVKTNPLHQMKIPMRYGEDLKYHLDRYSHFNGFSLFLSQLWSNYDPEVDTHFIVSSIPRESNHWATELFDFVKSEGIFHE